MKKVTNKTLSFAVLLFTPLLQAQTTTSPPPAPTFPSIVLSLRTACDGTRKIQVPAIVLTHKTMCYLWLCWPMMKTVTPLGLPDRLRFLLPHQSLMVATH